MLRVTIHAGKIIFYHFVSIFGHNTMFFKKKYYLEYSTPYSFTPKLVGLEPYVFSDTGYVYDQNNILGLATCLPEPRAPKIL